MQQIFATLFSFVAVAKTRMEEEKGATAVEYGLLVGLIAVAIIVTVGLLGGKLNDLFTNIKDSLPPKGTAGTPAG
jgi:pilus assembly protein Flp/PilA